MMIPDNTSDILPPIRPGKPGQSPDRSPYRVTLMDIVDRFSHSPERRLILKGFLDYRAAIHQIGLNGGFQWLDGSFLEAVENSQNRPPRDVDVVTFFHMPENMDQNTLVQKDPQLFDPKKTKKNFYVDSYFLSLETSNQQSFVKKVSYWYSLWSHTRAGVWKGFVEVDLSPSEEQACYNLLNSRNTA